MAELRRWSFAAFHTALLVTVGVGVLHVTGAVGDLLQGLNTAVGLGVYGLLWAVGWLITGRAFTAAPPADATLRALVGYGALYGAATAVAFILVLILGGGTLLAVLQGGSVWTVLLVAAVGALLAAAVGAVLGVIVGVLDALLARTGAALATPGP